MDRRTPKALEIQGNFRVGLGGRVSAAGLRVLFTDHLEPGIHFEAPPSEDPEYMAAIVHGLEDGLAENFPDYLETRCVVVRDIFEDEVESSVIAFYKVARMVVDQAHSYCLNLLPNKPVQPTADGRG